jgi:hypothetical protein
MSGAVAAGIGASVAVGVFAIFGVLLFMCLRRRRQRRSSIQQTQLIQPHDPSTPTTAMTQNTPHTLNEPFSPGNREPLPPGYPSIISPVTPRAELYHSDNFASEMASNGKLGDGHPLSIHERAGIPMRHELPSDNEIRPVLPTSPTSVYSSSPISRQNTRGENLKPAGLSFVR